MQISLLPNPATDYIRFVGLVSVMQLQIIDDQGLIVLDMQVEPDQRIELGDLQSGAYAYLLFDEGQSFAGKFMKL